jgi:hypothetical protein
LHVTQAKIQVKADELPPVQTCFHRVARAAVRGPIKVHDRFADHEPKEVSRVPRGSLLQGPDKGLWMEWLRCQPQVQIARRARHPQFQFERIAALQPPWWTSLGKQAHQQSVKRHLPPHTLKVDALRF